MRWIERGPKPVGVDGYASQFAQGWVDYFRHETGGRPTDSYWGEFRRELGKRSNNICWYCERRCEDASEVGGRAATVDHFRPLSRFPDLSYEWTNWIFSCKRCNGDYKQGKWPASGYVDPSAIDEKERPEQYFDYDMQTGEIIPHPSLTGQAKLKAEDTITDLGLNQIDVLFYRIDWTRQFVADLLTLPARDRQDFIDFSQLMEYAGVTGMVATQLRAVGEI